LDYMAANGYIGTFWQWREQNEGKIYNADIDLSPLAGRSVRFILTILATGNATNDRALWGSPRIVRSGATPPPVTQMVTPSATFTSTPDQDWLLYTNSLHGFQFRYPSQAQIVDQTDSSLKMNLPFMPGTNLREKYLQMTVRENVNPCLSPLADNGLPGAPENVTINGISFLKQTAADGGVGHLHEWVAYFTLKNNACISMDFVLHSLNPGNFSTPPPIFDKAAESAVFTQMMATFAFESATFTPLPPTVEPHVVPSPNIRRLFMIDSLNGWAIGNSYVLRTGDGGSTWYNMTMPGVSAVLNGFFQDSNRGWVLTPQGLYRTVEAGIRWTHYSVPFTGGYIQFLDERNGFVLSGEPSGMQKHAVYLYQTSDGGATWTLKYANDPSLPNNTLPFSGHKLGMAFRDASTGWVGGDYPTPGYVYLYRTIDSGVTWSQQSLTLPVGYENSYVTIESPRFFGLNDAVLPVWLSTNAGRDLFIYESYNGGETWTNFGGSVLQGRNTDFISVRDGFAWDANGFFHVTRNAGGTWSQVTPNVNFGDDVLALDFVSETTGWIAQNAVNGSTPLYRTTNSGNTWALVSGSSSPVTPPAQVLPDLTVVQTRIELQNTSCLMPGDPMGIRVWIKNNGQVAAGQFTVNVNSMNYLVTGLGAGETTAIFFPAYSNPVTATVDSLNMIVESDENNNSRSEMVPVPTPALPCATPTTMPSETPAPTPTSSTEDVSHDAFCADARIPVLIEQLKGSLNQSNGDMFASLVGPVHGVDVRLWAYRAPVNFSTTTARNVFTSTEVFTWGSGSVGGTEYGTGTFSQIIQPKMLEVFNAPNMETYCDNLTKVFPLSNPWPYPNIRYYNLYKPAMPGNDFDFRTWLIGFEYINNQPYLHSMVTIVWEP
ncbi:MAG TPA: CARDB domain-containing protein, partial [Anaerolineales bacterium]|nr:CARDB domain-containing protein [Anaerolineales bacterium]